ncbi:MAG: hypothetical protein DCC51_16900 [Anaerolineae bacterium]|nr:MAG: hypothetical protein DCC51_16900 [Anaerolineae bacterium]
MEQLQIWLGILAGSYLLIAVLLVMLDQPVRPIGNLLKATMFWFFISWVFVGIAMVVMFL